MSPVERVGPVTGMNFALGSYEKFQPVSDLKKDQSPCGRLSSGAQIEKQSKHGETQKL